MTLRLWEINPPRGTAASKPADERVLLSLKHSFAATANGNRKSTFSFLTSRPQRGEEGRAWGGGSEPVAGWPPGPVPCLLRPLCQEEGLAVEVRGVCRPKWAQLQGRCEDPQGELLGLGSEW